MSFNEKYQAGESYGDNPGQAEKSLLDNPTQFATDILKDYASARGQASLAELVQLFQSLKSGGPSDDRKG